MFLNSITDHFDFELLSFKGLASSIAILLASVSFHLLVLLCFCCYPSSDSLLVGKLFTN
jgi:hypothetical protein